MATSNPHLMGQALAETYPAFARTYQRLMRRIGVTDPARLVVSEEFAARAPTVALPYHDAIVVTPEFAALGDSPVVRGALGHEKAHILTGKSPDTIHIETKRSAPWEYWKNHRLMEQEMDRIGTLIAGSREAMLATREWYSALGVEATRRSNGIEATTMLSRTGRMLQRWMEDRSYDFVQGRPGTIRQNIMNVDLKDRSHLQGLVERYNARKSGHSR